MDIATTPAPANYQSFLDSRPGRLVAIRRQFDLYSETMDAARRQLLWGMLADVHQLGWWDGWEDNKITRAGTGTFAGNPFLAGNL